jgi:hypothetical protein
MQPQSLRAVLMALALTITTLACSRGVLHTGAAGTTPASPTPVPIHGDTCDPGLTACPGPSAGYCFDLQASPEHCGTCDNACALGSPCENGQCRVFHCTSQVSVRSLQTDSRWTYFNRPALLDCDRDGALDMIALSPPAPIGGESSPEDLASSVSVYHGNGDGTFALAERYRSQVSPSGWGILQILAADLNRDQIPDLIMLGEPLLQPDPGGAPITIVVRLGNGDCTFGPEIGLVAGASPSNFTIADLDGDGILDLVVVVEGGQHVRAFHGHGDGSFSELQDLVVSGLPSKVVITDWNSDGIPDLVTAEEYLHLMLGTGNGQFAPAIDCSVRFGDLYANGRAVPPVIADFDHDGLMDLATDNTVLFGMHECNYTRLVTFDAPNNSALPLLAGDFNGDGALDLVLSTWQGLGFLPGDGRGDFGTMVILEDYGSARQAQAASCDTFAFPGDFNGDGRLDLAVARQSGIRIFINTCQ